MAGSRKRGASARFGTLRHPSRRRHRSPAPNGAGESACGSGPREGSRESRDRGDHRGGRRRPPWVPFWETW